MRAAIVIINRQPIFETIPSGVRASACGGAVTGAGHLCRRAGRRGRAAVPAPRRHLTARRRAARAAGVYCGPFRGTVARGGGSERSEDHAMTLSDRTLTLVAMIAIGLSLLAIVFVILGGSRGGDEREISRATTPSARCSAKIDQLEQAVRALNATDTRQQVQIEGSVRRVGVLRYDAFDDVGGRLSFSCALLDEHAHRRRADVDQRPAGDAGLRQAGHRRTEQLQPLARRGRGDPPGDARGRARRRHADDLEARGRAEAAARRARGRAITSERTSTWRTTMR